VKLQKIALMAAILWGGFTTLSQAAIINISLFVGTEDGFTLRNASNSALANNSLVRIGYFYDPSNGNGLSSTSISALYQPSATFAANNSALLAKFLEIGTGATGYTQLNGLANGFLGQFSSPDRLFGTAPHSFAKLDDYNNQIAGSFTRGWADATLPIEKDTNISPFNSLTTVKLAGALLSAIVYNNSSSDSSNELMVVRALGGTGVVLPSEDGESVAFSFGATTSEILVGTSVTGGYQTIPEPGSGTLVGLGVALLLGLRRKFSLHL
jgi:hypothetical protein